MAVTPSPVLGAIPGGGGELRPPAEPAVKPAFKAGIGDRPHPVLQDAGFHTGGVADFNKRVASIVDAHKQATGTLPSKALVMDIVRSPVDPLNYPRLFQFPTPDTAKLH